jgi:hypothetical protein
MSEDNVAISNDGAGGALVPACDHDGVDAMCSEEARDGAQSRLGLTGHDA